MWGENEGRAWMSLGGVGHVELSEGIFGLTSIKHEEEARLLDQLLDWLHWKSDFT